MDMSEVKAFNAELSGLYDNKPPISKAKMSAITRGAIKAIKFYKHVVHSVEKFIQKCKPEYKVPGLYVIDSIVRQSRHQFGQDKDVFAPRFAKNMQQTFANLFRCPPEEKRNIIRVLNLWQKNKVFSSEVIQPLLDMADPNHPLHLEIQQQQNNAANGSSLNLSHSASDAKTSPAPAQHTPHGSSPMGEQFQDAPSGGSNVKFNRKLLNDFEYESEDDAPPEPARPAHSSHSSHTTHTTHTTHTSHAGHTTQQAPPPEALGSILTNPEIMRQLQSLQAQMQLMTGMQMPNLMPMMNDMQNMQQQHQTLPFLNSQQDQQKQGEAKDEMGNNNESDIEFVETGPQVIEIPDANDSRSPSPRSRRHRTRSRSPRRRRRSRSRSRSRSPRHARRRDRDRDRDKDREKSNKEREAEREKQKEREKKGLPPIKKENLSVCSTTLWVGHLSKLATPEELSDLFGGIGGVLSIDVVAPRGCAFVVMERRRDAYKALQKLNKHKLHSKEITVAWAPGKGVKGREWKDYWEAELGVAYLPWAALHQRWQLGALSLDALEDGGAVDEDTLPPWLPPRIIPKIMEPMPLMGMSQPPGVLPNMGGMPAMASMPLPTSMPAAMPSLLGAGLQTAPANIPLPVPRMPPPGMTAGIPPGMAPGMPPGIRPPSIPTGVPGLQGDAGLPPATGLLGFPPGMAPQSIGQPGAGMLGGFLLGGVRPVLASMPPLMAHAPRAPPAALAHHASHAPPPAARTTEISQGDDAMELDNEDTHEESQGQKEQAPPQTSLSDQLQALISKPPPNFNASEPPPNFNINEPPPFTPSQPPPAAEEKDDDRRDKDRDRRDRDRRDRDRDRDRRGDRDRGRDRGGGRDRDRERDGGDRRDRDRDRGGRDRRERDRERDRDRDRFGGRDNNERSRDKSPRGGGGGGGGGADSAGAEKSLQERLWEMANGKPADKRDDTHDQVQTREEPHGASEEPPRMERPPPLIDRLPPMRSEPMDSDGGEERGGGGDGWSAAPARAPPLAPPFRAELRMRGPPRQPMRGPWMEGPGPGPGPFGPRFNGMGPPFNRPPFERAPFEGGPIFDGPPRFERPPFNRMPFDNMNRPPFDGPRPPFDGPRPPFDGPRPPFDGPRPPFDGPGPMPPYNDQRPPFEGPRSFDGDRQYDNPRFDQPEFFDRNNRRFDDREQFNERGWNGERDREWDNRRNEWDERRRDRRPREHEDRFRDRGDNRNDRRKNFDDRRSQRDERNQGRDDRGTSREGRSKSRDDRHASKDDKNASRDDKNAPKDDKNAPRNDKDLPKNDSDTQKDDKNERSAPREERRRDRDRKSRWGAAEEAPQEELKPQNQMEVQTNVESGCEKAENQIAETSHIEQDIQSQNKVESNITEEKLDQPLMDTSESFSQISEPRHEESFHENQEKNKEDNAIERSNITLYSDQEQSNTIDNKQEISSNIFEKQSSFEREEAEVPNYEKPSYGNEEEMPERQENYESKDFSSNYGLQEAPNLEHQESNNSFDTSQQLVATYTGTLDNNQDNTDKIENMIALYDAGDAIDTSFSVPIMDTTPSESATEKQSPETDKTTVATDDIFSQPESRTDTQEGNDQSNVETKEGAA